MLGLHQYALHLPEYVRAHVIALNVSNVHAGPASAGPWDAQFLIVAHAHQHCCKHQVPHAAADMMQSTLCCACDAHVPPHSSTGISDRTCSFTDVYRLAVSS
jgi:hypothetical protein